MSQTSIVRPVKTGRAHVVIMSKIGHCTNQTHTARPVHVHFFWDAHYVNPPTVFLHYYHPFSSIVAMREITRISGRTLYSQPWTAFEGTSIMRRPAIDLFMAARSEEYFLLIWCATDFAVRR